MRRRRLILGVAASVVVAAVLVLVVTPLWLRHRAEAQVRSAGCAGNTPPGAGFYQGVRDDQRADGFPGFGPSDVVMAEAVLCLGRFAQACLAAERLTGTDRAATCEPWHEFARWVDSLGDDADGMCIGCPELTSPRR